jgi:hypothetical protein
MMTAGLAALKTRDLPAAKAQLDRAVKILGVTHGKQHAVTSEANQTLQLVAQILGDGELHAYARSQLELASPGSST